MSHKRNHNPGNRSSERARLIRDADLLFADAKEAQARAEVVERLNALWLQAGGLFKRASNDYRLGSLGLMAKESLQQAAYCYGRAGATQQAADCEQRARIIPTHYEETEDE